MASQPYPDGAIATNPDTGQTLVRQGGVWVPQQQSAAPRSTSPQPLIQRTPAPRYPDEASRSQSEAAAAQFAPERARAEAQRAAAEAEATAAQTRRGGLTGEQADQQSRYRADLEAFGTALERLGSRYQRDFENNDPLISLGFSENERGFDQDAETVRQLAQGVFRVPGLGSQSDYEARALERAYGLNSTNYDVNNESVMDALQERLNRRRAAIGLPPVDWRQGGGPAVPGAAGPSAPPVNPNSVQPGEGMGQVGSLPPLTDMERSQGSGENQLDNAGGTYATQEDRARAEQLAGIATAMARGGATPETINQWLRGEGLNPLSPADADLINSYRRRGQSRQFPGFSPNVIPTGRSDPNLTTGAANSSTGAYVIGAGDALTFGTLDNLTADPERTRAGMELLREEHPVATLVGEASGSLLPGAALERAAAYGIRGLNSLRGGSNIGRATGELSTLGELSIRPAGNALYGGAYGAGSADEGNRLIGAVRGAGFSTLGGEAGARLTGGAGRVLSGIRDSSVRALAERNIPMTLGQMSSRGGRLGRVATSVENALESVPLLGDAIRARRADSFRAVNEAAFSEALDPINATTGGGIGEEGVERARTAVGNAYSGALNDVRVAADPDFVAEMRAAMDLGRNLPPDLRADFEDFVQNRLAHEMANGELTGPGYQALRQELRAERAAARGHLGSRTYVTTIKRMEGALERLVRRQAPDAVPALEAADQAFRRTRVVEGAVGRAMNNKEQGGVFTPAQLGMEARANANRFGGNGATTSRPFYNLQREAQDVLPSSLPNSGTADRQWVLAAFPAIAAGGAQLTGVVDPKTAALFGALGLPYTRAGQRLFQKMLTARPEAVRRAGEAVLGQRRLASRAGAGAVNQETDQTPSPSGR